MRELLGSERYGLAPETRQSLLALRVFQQMDGAILCLLQQPGGAAGAAPRPWHSLRRCCESQRDGMGRDRGDNVLHRGRGSPRCQPRLGMEGQRAALRKRTWGVGR